MANDTPPPPDDSPNAPQSVPLTSIGGRYPGGAVVYRSEQIRAVIQAAGTELTIRIDDDANSDRWEEFTVPRHLIEQLLRHAPGSSTD